jgi:hypothetical protein
MDKLCGNRDPIGQWVLATTSLALGSVAGSLGKNPFFASKRSLCGRVLMVWQDFSTDWSFPLSSIEFGVVRYCNSLFTEVGLSQENGIALLNPSTIRE